MGWVGSASAFGVVVEALEQGVGFGGELEPVAENDFRHVVVGVVEELGGLVVGRDPACLDGDAGVEAFLVGVDENLGVLVVDVLLGFAGAFERAGDGCGVGGEVDASGVGFAHGVEIHDHVDGVEFLKAELDADIGSAGADEGGYAPLVGDRVFGDEDALACVAADHEAAAVVEGENDALSVLEDFSRDGGGGIRHDFLEYVFA